MLDDEIALTAYAQVGHDKLFNNQNENCGKNGDTHP